MARKRGSRRKPNTTPVRVTDNRREANLKVVSARLSDKTGQKKVPISRDLRNTGAVQKQGVSDSDARNQKKAAATREPLKRDNCKKKPDTNRSKGGGSRKFVKWC